MEVVLSKRNLSFLLVILGIDLLIKCYFHANYPYLSLEELGFIRFLNVTPLYKFLLPITDNVSYKGAIWSMLFYKMAYGMVKYNELTIACINAFIYSLLIVEIYKISDHFKFNYWNKFLLLLCLMLYPPLIYFGIESRPVIFEILVTMFLFRKWLRREEWTKKFWVDLVLPFISFPAAGIRLLLNFYDNAKTKTKIQNTVSLLAVSIVYFLLAKDSFRDFYVEPIKYEKLRSSLFLFPFLLILVLVPFNYIKSKRVIIIPWVIACMTLLGFSKTIIEDANEVMKKQNSMGRFIRVNTEFYVSEFCVERNLFNIFDQYNIRRRIVYYYDKPEDIDHYYKTKGPCYVIQKQGLLGELVEQGLFFKKIDTVGNFDFVKILKK
jgi:hypothetical protein